MDFAQALKDRRASRRLSQLELALRAGTADVATAAALGGRAKLGA